MCPLSSPCVHPFRKSVAMSHALAVSAGKLQEKPWLLSRISCCWRAIIWFLASGCLQLSSSDEETFHGETGAVLGVDLLLHEDSWSPSCRIRPAELLQGIATISSPDGTHVGGERFHCPNSWSRSVNLSVNFPGRAARFGIGVISCTATSAVAFELTSFDWRHIRRAHIG